MSLLRTLLRLGGGTSVWFGAAALAPQRAHANIDYSEYVVGDWDGNGTSDLGFRAGHCVYMDSDGDGIGEVVRCHGNGPTEDQYLIGNWDGVPGDELAVRRGNCVIFEKPLPGWVQCYGNGAFEDEYLVGDWDGDGRDNLAVRRGNQILMDVNYDGLADRSFNYGDGLLEEQYLVGNWDGLGGDDIAVRRGSAVLMDTDFDPYGYHNILVNFSPRDGYAPAFDVAFLAGDWDGDRRTDLGLRLGAFFSLCRDPASNDCTTRVFGPDVTPRPVAREFLGNAPRDSGNGWSDTLNGVATDGKFWWFTQEHRLFKLPIDRDLRQNLRPEDLRIHLGGSSSPAIPPSAIPGGNHMGDLEFYKGLLYVPIEGTQSQGVAVFEASTLKFLTYQALPSHIKAAAIAINPVSGDVLVPNSNFLGDFSGPGVVYAYRLDHAAARAGRPFLWAKRHVPLTSSDGRTPVKVGEYLQGLAFSSDGRTLYLSNGKETSSGFIWVFDARTGQLIDKSTNGSGTFNFENRGGLTTREEAEGLAYFDLEDGRAGVQIRGKLHVLLVDYDTIGTTTMFFKHYR